MNNIVNIKVYSTVAKAWKDIIDTIDLPQKDFSHILKVIDRVKGDIAQVTMRPKFAKVLLAQLRIIIYEILREYINHGYAWSHCFVFFQTTSIIYRLEVYTHGD